MSKSAIGFITSFLPLCGVFSFGFSPLSFLLGVFGFVGVIIFGAFWLGENFD